MPLTPKSMPPINDEHVNILKTYQADCRRPPTISLTGQWTLPALHLSYTGCTAQKSRACMCLRACAPAGLSGLRPLCPAGHLPLAGHVQYEGGKERGRATCTGSLGGRRWCGCSSISCWRPYCCYCCSGPADEQ